MTWNIIVDSSSDLLTGALQSEHYRLKSVPLTIQVADRSYPDNETLHVDELIRDMMSTKSASSTACPSPEAFQDAFSDADCSICFTLTGALSGTYNCAVLAREMVLEKYPEKKILIIDSKSTAGSLPILAREAGELIAQGSSFEEVAEKMVQRTPQKLLFTLACFDNLVKNGRMNALVGFIAGKLNIRAIACNTEQGEIKVLKKCHGEPKTFDELVKLLVERRIGNGPIYIHHCQNPEGAKKLSTLISEATTCKDITILSCRGLTSYYAMPGGILVGF